MQMLPLLLVLAAARSLLASSKIKEQPPHIVTIMVDDMGWNDVGFHGSNQIPTPNIDALAYNGVILNRHYTLPTCTPSRTAYLTGKYPIRTGMQGFPLRAGEPRGLPLEEKTLPERLRELGYVTRLIGKWHQGSYRSEFTPTNRGFDSFLGYWNGFIGYFDHKAEEKGVVGVDFHRNNCSTDAYIGRYATDVFTDEAVSIIKRHPPDRPLYLQLSHLAVHSGISSRLLEVPDLQETHRRFGYIKDPQRRLYAGMVRSLDDSVGKVVSALSNSNLLSNSIILFMTDNGAQSVGFLRNSGSNWPLRGLKFTQFEGAVRGVAAIWSPSLWNPGRVANQLVHITDWLPTLYSAAGGNVTELGELDGIDQWKSLLTKEGPSGGPRKQLLVNVDQTQGAEAFIDQGWKIIKGDFENGIYDGYYGADGRGSDNPAYDTVSIISSDVNRALQKARRRVDAKNFNIDDSFILRVRDEMEINSLPNVTVTKNVHTTFCIDYCLFDLVNDPCETRDLASKHPKKVEELKAYLEVHKKWAVPELNQPVDPASNPALHDGKWVCWRDKPRPHVDQCVVGLTSNSEGGPKPFVITMFLLAFVFSFVNKVFCVPMNERYFASASH